MSGSIITAHWSATGPQGPIFDGNQPAYHVQCGLIRPSGLKLNRSTLVRDVDFAKLRKTFDLWKCTPLDQATSWGTWMWNHSPVDGVSPNIEVGALCMGGEHVGMTQWGQYPFTFDHAWMMAAVCARIAILKDIDVQAAMSIGGVYQNGPFYRLSTHGERAYQTKDSEAVVRPGYGDFAYGGDPQCRWDLSALDPLENASLGTPEGAVTMMQSSANWLRNTTHEIKALLLQDKPGIDFWSLNV